MSDVSAATILFALRIKFRNASVVREVSIPDLHEESLLKLALRGRHEELPAGWHPQQARLTRRIDALVIGSGVLTAVEIKVDRGDFRRDDLRKRQAWMEVTDRFIYAIPRGLATPAEVGPGCGLLEFDAATFQPDMGRSGLTTAKNATKNRKRQPLPTSVLSGLAGRVSTYERAVERERYAAEVIRGRFGDVA